MSNTNRRSAGTPTGGQFAATKRTESPVKLETPTPASASDEGGAARLEYVSRERTAEVVVAQRAGRIWDHAAERADPNSDYYKRMAMKRGYREDDKPSWVAEGQAVLDRLGSRDEWVDQSKADHIEKVTERFVAAGGDPENP